MKRKRDKAARNVHTAPVICLCFSFHRSVSITGISSGWDKIGKKVNTINYLILFVVIDINFHDKFDKSHKDETYTEKYTETKHKFSCTFNNVQIINETYFLFIIHLLM